MLRKLSLRFAARSSFVHRPAHGFNSTAEESCATATSSSRCRASTIAVNHFASARGFAKMSSAAVQVLNSDGFVDVGKAVDAVLQFWFGADENSGTSHMWWFRGGKEIDDDIRNKFGDLVEKALRGELDATWPKNETRGLLALIILLDQMPRNIFRGTAKMYAGDAVAYKLTEQGLDSGLFSGLNHVQMMFATLPLQHCEDKEGQARSLVEIRKMGAANPSNQSNAMLLRFAQEHHDVVMRFGRFPHRNAILGRVSTPEEEEHLNSGQLKSWEGGGAK